MSDLFDEFKATKILIDRSDLERCAECPMQMRLLRERKRVVGTAANIGQEVHDAISKTIASYIDAGGMISRSDLADELTRNLQFTRPDVQPQAIEAAKAVVWAVARMINETDPDAILHFDGGEGKRSGQFAWDIDDDVRLTQEADLVLGTASKEVLRVPDWKSGRGVMDIDDVRDSFQFQELSVLIFQTYPDVQRIDVVVCNTRQGFPLPPVHFHRSKLPQYIARLRTAVNAWVDNEEKPLEQVACWPATEKCRLCDAAIDCPAAEWELKADPADLFRQKIAAEAKVAAIEEVLQAAVAKAGAPVRTPDGDCYGKRGAEKPRETWKSWKE